MVYHSTVHGPGADRAVGRSALRREDLRLLTGRGQYLADVSLPRMLVAVFIRSDLPDAHVRGIDFSSALGVPGVEAIYTANDLPRATLWLSKHPNLKITRQPVLAVDRVRFVGEPLAIVMAEDRYAADDASELVTVDYEPIDSARIPLFDHIPDNVVFRESKQWGEIDHAFANATKIVSSSFRNARQLACPLETRGCIASFDPFSRQLVVWASTQVPHRLRSELATAIGLPVSNIRVVMQDIGGGFGQKIPTHVE
jgi:CO/xanthine dehydrogenase Mo-binding subunit